MDIKMALRVITTLFLVPYLFLHLGCSLMEGDEEKAERFYQAGIKALGEELLDEAVIQFRNSIQRNPSHAKAHYQLGRLYLKLNQDYQAITQMSLAVKHAPDFHEARRALAMAQFHNRNFSEAATEFKELIKR